MLTLFLKIWAWVTVAIVVVLLASLGYVYYLLPFWQFLMEEYLTKLPQWLYSILWLGTISLIVSLGVLLFIVGMKDENFEDENYD